MKDNRRSDQPLLEPGAAPERRLGFVMHRVGHEIGRLFEKELDAYGIGSAHFGVLSALKAYGPMHQQQLVRFLGLNRQTLVNVVNELEGRGFIERKKNELDKRTLVLHLTAAGVPFLDQVDRASLSIEAAIFETFSAEQRQQLYLLIHQLAASGQLGDLFSPQDDDAP